MVSGNHISGNFASVPENDYKVKQYENRALLMPHYYTFFVENAGEKPGRSMH
jgi:hypothetical protein